MNPNLLSIITPVFNEAESLEKFHERLRHCLDAHEWNWEWLAVDDGSTDASPRMLREFASADSRLRILTQDRNRGSHAAIFRGLREARGEAAVVLAADLQDPPEVIPKLLETWRSGAAALVWAARTRPEGASAWDRFCSVAFHAAVRRWTGLPVPRYGADCFLASRSVLQEVTKWESFGPNLILRLMSMPGPQTSVPMARFPRQRGQSGWTLSKRLKLAIFSLFSHSINRSGKRGG